MEDLGPAGGDADLGARDLTLWYLFDKPLPNRLAASIQILRTGASMPGANAGFVCLCGRLEGNEAQVLARYGLTPRPGFALRPLFPGPGAPDRRRDWLAGRAVRRMTVEIAAMPGRHVLMCRGNRGIALLGMLAPVARAAGLPVVYEMHCLDYLRSAERRAGRTVREAELTAAAQAARERERAAAQLADAYVFLTEGIEAAARAELGLEGPALVLPSGTEAAPSAGPAAAPRYDVVYAGKIEARKGVHALCAVMRHLPGRRLAIAGGPASAVEDLRRWLRGQGLEDRVDLVGFLPPAEVAAFLRSGRVGACPMTVGVDSVADRFTSPLKLLQMMGLGMAVVATDVAPVRAVAADGETALLAPPDDPAAFAAAVERLLGDPALAARLGAAAARAAERWSWDARAAALADFLDRIARPQAGAPRHAARHML
jgi:glycosyltransferase involved in cell wall biosynthesis